METLDRIVELMKQNQCENRDLAKHLNLNRQVVTDWKAHRSKSYKKYLPQIAGFFGVSVEYLLGNESVSRLMGVGDEVNLKLTEHEKNLLQAYRLQPEMQPAVDRLLGVKEDDKILVYNAAHSETNHPDGREWKDKSRWQKIEDAPETEDDLL